MWGEFVLYAIFQPYLLYMAVSFHSWRNKLFLGVNQQPSVSNWQLPLMGFEPQGRGASSFKGRRLTHSATEAPLCNYRWGELVLYAIFQPCLVIYGSLFPQLEEQIVPGSEPATFHLATDNYLSWDLNPSRE